MFGACDGSVAQNGRVPGNINAVMDREIDGFINAYLAQQSQEMFRLNRYPLAVFSSSSNSPKSSAFLIRSIRVL